MLKNHCEEHRKNRRFKAGTVAASLLLFLFAAVFVFCTQYFSVEVQAEDTAELDPLAAEIQEKKTHTVMIYMIGSNLESRLGSATKDLEEMEAAGLDYRDVNVLVFTGGSRRWVGEVPCDRNCVLDLSRPVDERIVAETEENYNMGDPETLSEFVNFCTEYYPAEHNSLIFWDHGGGPLIGYGSDELFEADSLTLNEMKTAMLDTAFAKDQKLDLVGFDACLMGSIENMKLWADHADYFVASEEIEPGDGWDYTFLKILEETEDPSVTAKTVTEHYSGFYETIKTSTYDPDLTLSCIDLGRIGELSDAVNALAGKMIKDYKKGSYSAVMQKRADAKSFGLVENTKGYISYYYDLVDLSDLSDQLSGLYPAETESIRARLNDCVIHATTNVERAGGISIYFPYRNKGQYNKMKAAYKNITVSSNYSKFLDLSAVYWMKSKWRNWDLGKPVDNGEEYVLALTQEQIANSTGAYYTIVSENGSGGYVPLMTRCRLYPDDEGILHLPKKIPMIALRSDDGETMICPVAEIESDDTRILYRTQNASLRSDLTYTRHIEDLENQGVTVVLGLDLEENELSIRSFNDSSQEIDLGGKNTIDVSNWECITFTQNPSYTTRNENGTVLPFREWNQTGLVTWSDLAIDEEFGFEQIPSTDCNLHLKCQIEIEDINGECYASELADLPANEESKEIEFNTEDGTITFAVYPDHAEAIDYAGHDVKLQIPDQVNNVPVTAIKAGAFGKLDLYSAYGTYPFESVTIPDTVKEIGSGAFYACAKLKSIHLPADLEKIGSAAFSMCTKLADVALPQSLKMIGKSAFSYCTSLEEITLPTGIESIGTGAFMGCESLKRISLSLANTGYKVVDNSLYTSDGKILLAHPGADEADFVIAEGTEKIAYGACASSIMKKAVFPKSLRTIGNYAFYACNTLIAPEFPSALTVIGMHAFDTHSWGLQYGSAANMPQKIQIGPDLQYLGAHAFDLFLNKSFSVDPENRRYLALEGALMNGAGDTVLSLSFNNRRQIILPDGTVEFAFDMLEFLDNINTLSTDVPRHLYLPESVLRFPETVQSYEIDDLTIHCVKGSAAEEFAIRFGIPFSNEMSAAYKTTEVATKKGSLTARVYTDYAMITRYSGEDSVLEIPESIDNRPVKVIGDNERAISVNGYYYGTDGSLTEAPNLSRIVLPEGVEEISRNALNGFSNMNSVSVILPSTVKSIGETALTNCKGITIPEGVERLGYQFINTEPEEDFFVTESIRYIDPGAFSKCDSITAFHQKGTNEYYSVVDGILYSADEKTLISYPAAGGEECIVPEGTETIGKNAFYQRSNLKKAAFPASLKEIDDAAFRSCWNLEQVAFSQGSLTAIGSEAFRFCSKITEVSLPKTERIGAYAFYGCSELAALHLQEGLKEIGESAFGQTKIIDPALPDSVQTVGNQAFYDYNEMTQDAAPDQLAIGNNLEEIGYRAFGCIKAKAYAVEEENSNYCSINGFLADKGKNVILDCPAGMSGEAYIPYGVSAIASFAFSNPNTVTILHIPDTVEYIGSANFERRRVETADASDEVYKYSVTICCKKDSYAHRFAMDREIPYVFELADP